MINLITISRERGSGGRSVGDRLAQDLGMECFGKEIVYDIAQSAGVAKESVEKYDQEHYNKWNLIVDSLRISSHFSPDYGFNFSLANIEPEIFFTEDKYLKTTQEILTKLGSRPGVISAGPRQSDDFQGSQGCAPHSTGGAASCAHRPHCRNAECLRERGCQERGGPGQIKSRVSAKLLRNRCERRPVLSFDHQHRSIRLRPDL